jgi:hypothetical protein
MKDLARFFEVVAVVMLVALAACLMLGFTEPDTATRELYEACALASLVLMLTCAIAADYVRWSGRLNRRNRRKA